MSTLAIWLLILAAVLFGAVTALVVRAGLVTYRHARTLGNELRALQEDLAEALGSVPPQGVASGRRPETGRAYDGGVEAI